MFHEDIVFLDISSLTVNIYMQLNVVLVIYISRDLTWTTLKANFSICKKCVLHPQIPDFQIVGSRPNIVPS